MLMYFGSGHISRAIRAERGLCHYALLSGPYLDDPVEREKFSKAYMAMTEAFLALPICLPGTDVWKGRQGRLFIIKVWRDLGGRRS